MQVRLTETVLQRTARMLSAKYGIRVVFQGSVPCTDGDTIYLPRLSHDAPEELVEALQGYLDHETGHVLFTDFNAWQAAAEDEEEFSADAMIKSQFYRCINFVEDPRIEFKMMELFPGSSQNLRNAHVYLSQKNRKRWTQGETAEAPGISDFDKILIGFFMESRFPNSNFYQEMVEDHLKLHVEHCLTLADYATMKDTQDAIEAGKRIYEYLKDFAEEDKKEKSGWETKYGKEVPGKSETHHSMFEELAEELQKEVEKIQSDQYQHNLSSDDSYEIWSTALDKYVVSSRDEGHTSDLLRMRSDGQELTGIIRNRLINHLRTITHRRWSSGREQGRLDARCLSRVLHQEYNVYKDRSAKVDMDVAFAFGIDHSTSMSFAKRIELATACAIILGDVLNSVRIPFLTYGYSTVIPKESPPDPERFGRYCGHWVKVYKTFEHVWEQQAVALSNAPASLQHNTLDGESVLFGLQELMKRPESRRVLFVFTDGYPEPGYGDAGRCQKYLKAVIDTGLKQGIEIIAFGIQTDSVKHYYPNHVIIKDLRDLVATPLVRLEELLRKRG